MPARGAASPEGNVRLQQGPGQRSWHSMCCQSQAALQSKLRHVQQMQHKKPPLAPAFCRCIQANLQPTLFCHASELSGQPELRVSRLEFPLLFQLCGTRMSAGKGRQAGM